MTTATEESAAQFIFRDSQYSFQALRAVSATNGQAADIGECLATCRAIQEGDSESWIKEWSNLAKRNEDAGHQYLQKGHNESARTAYLRASNYYRTSEFFLHTTPQDPRILQLWGKSRSCFQEVAELSSLPIQQVKIPFENTFLPGYFCRAVNDGTPRPLVMIQTGFDGTAEELYYQIAYAGLARGYNCLLFEGPGQGAVIREQGIHFRPNWETVITPVVDFALQQKGVDKERMALVGISFGGYLVPRALAFEPRIKLGVVNGGVYDFYAVCTRGDKAFQDALDTPESSQEVDEEIAKLMQTSAVVKWAFGNGMYTFGAKTPSEWLRMTRQYQMKDVIGQIKAKMLVVDSEHDEDMPGQSKLFYEQLKGSKSYVKFLSKDGAGEHCQIGAYSASNETIFNWIGENL